MSAQKTYTRRLFVTYQAMVAGETKDLDGLVETFATVNADVDLDEPLTFAQWSAEISPPAKARAAR
jgi:hypothetical protein